MTCGIYILTFTGTDKVYIGQSVNIERRIQNHRTKLKSGLSSLRLQEAFNKYGDFTYEILVECTEDELDEKEEELIRIFDAYTNGLNSMDRATNGQGLSGEAHPGSRFSKNTIIKVFMYLVNNTDLTYADIAELTGTNKSLVIEINSCKRHKWLKEEFPDKYCMLNQTNRLNGRNNKRKEKYPQVKNKEGIIFDVVPSALAFSKLHGIHSGHFNELLNGKAKTVKGWTTVEQLGTS